MKKALRIFAIILTLMLVSGVACAEGINLDQYTYEQLVQLRQQVDERIKEMERQYAIDNADREISFQQPEYVLYISKSVTLLPQVTILSDDAPSQTTFVWSSSDPEIATVTQKGTVTAKASGDVVISAAAQDNEYLEGTCVIHCAIPVTVVSILGIDEPLVLSSYPEEATGSLDFSIEPEDAYCQEVTWQSSDETIVTVDAEGNITGLRPGTAEIYAISAENPPAGSVPVRAVCSVKVIQKATGIELAETTRSMTVGERITLKPAVLPENANDKAVIYTSTDPEVATVDENGTVTAVGCGECDIVCEARGGEGVSVSCHITATKLITAIALSDTSIILPLGQTRVVETVITPEDASRQDVIWTSSNVFVARVAAGKIEAIRQGDCVITCTTMDGSNLQASVNVHVPTFSIDEEAYTVTDKDGLVIYLHPISDACEITYTSDSACYTILEEGKDQLRIVPVAAGSGTLTLVNTAAPEDKYVIQVMIDNQAVYDDVSYPPASYIAIMTNPDEYEDRQISIPGKVLQFTDAEKGRSAFYLGTGGKEYSDQVILVQGDAAILPEELAEGDMLTIYGVIHLEREYSELLETETINNLVIEAEKIEKNAL